MAQVTGRVPMPKPRPWFPGSLSVIHEQNEIKEIFTNI